MWRKNASATDLQLQRRSRLLTVAERNFFECLINSLSDEFYIFTKVRMLDIVQPIPSSSWLEKRAIKQRLANECLDYVLCKPDDMSIFGVIELENFDKGTNKKVRELREKLVSDVCKTANLRLFYFDIRQDYRSMDIRRLVTGRSAPKDAHSSASQHSQLTVDGASVTDFGKLHSCPKCHSEVVTKVAVKGKRIGEKFLMCRKYPYCDYQVSMNDAKILKMHWSAG